MRKYRYSLQDFKELFFDYLMPTLVTLTLAFAFVSVFYALYVSITNKVDDTKPPEVKFQTFEKDEVKYTIVKHEGSWFLVVKTNNSVAIAKY